MYELSKSEGYMGKISKQSVGKKLFLLSLAEKIIWISIEDIFCLKVMHMLIHLPIPMSKPQIPLTLKYQSIVTGYHVIMFCMGVAISPEFLTT